MVEYTFGWVTLDAPLQAQRNASVETAASESDKSGCAVCACPAAHAGSDSFSVPLVGWASQLRSIPITDLVVVEGGLAPSSGAGPWRQVERPRCSPPATVSRNCGNVWRAHQIAISMRLFAIAFARSEAPISPIRLQER